MEPFELSTSLTRRMQYGNSASDGDDGLERTLGERAVADLAAAGAAGPRASPTEYGGKL